MIQTCHHVMPSGIRCQAPAMRGYAFCYHHARRVAPVRNQHKTEARVDLPTVLDREGIARALGLVLQSLASGAISPRRASALLYGLQMATANPQESEVESSTSPLDPLPADLLLRLQPALGQTPACARDRKTP